VRTVHVNSAVYTGHIRHRRFAERERSFKHRIALAYIELGERQAAFVRARIATEAGSAPDGPVRVLTHPRGFNPVSFYYCFDRNGQLQALLAEVTNTPWGERQDYVLTRADHQGCVLRGRSQKLMHVSPFFGMDQLYEWRVAEPGTTISVHIENREHGLRAFDATLSLRRRKPTPLSRAAVRASSLRTLALIYAHAAVIRARGIRTRPHPARAAG
jgi:DUF1365 family protein